MKVGDKAYGFKFERFNNSDGVNYIEEMNKFIDVEGTIVRIESKKFSLRFSNNNYLYWEYPISEYLSYIRDKKLNELGIQRLFLIFVLNI